MSLYLESCPLITDVAALITGSIFPADCPTQSKSSLLFFSAAVLYLSTHGKFGYSCCPGTMQVKQRHTNGAIKKEQTIDYLNTIITNLI